MSTPLLNCCWCQSAHGNACNFIANLFRRSLRLEVMAPRTSPSMWNVYRVLLLALCIASIRPTDADSQCAWDTHMSPAAASGKNTRRLIDISVTIHNDLPSWEKLEGLGAHRELVERQDQGGVAFVSKLSLVVHTATHFDAPSHFLQEAFDSGRGIEAVQLSIMNGESPYILRSFACALWMVCCSQSEHKPLGL